ncbi:methyltransferase family protein [Rhizobium sp. BR 314]|uniref:methyltransferase family protein n=1 Tax=Rhizobium sp. BR 314 TaxID=3040013 RepID=UPI0039BED114
MNLLLPEPLMWLLRWALLLEPLALLALLVYWRRPSHRQQVAAFFAFLYGLSAVFATHTLAIAAGWWSYGWNALMLNGIPADILFGGAILFGPVLYLAFPRSNPVLMCTLIAVVMHGLLFTSLTPLVSAGPNWMFGIGFVFATAHVPSLYLARWTERNILLPFRAALLAIMYACLSLGILPSLIMAAMGGEWAITTHPAWRWAGLLGGLLISFVIGLSAVQMLAVQGLGTAIPLDPTRRLVTTGIYSYIRNPMQLSAALSWTVLGVFLGNIWIAAAAVMAWIFVEGIVRWHHRHDLQQRFPHGWVEYRNAVPEWLPLWRPHCTATARVHLNTDRLADRLTGMVIERIGPTALEINQGSACASYMHPDDYTPYSGVAALCMALTHGNFVTALIGHLFLLPTLCLRAFSSKAAAA